MVDRLLPTGEQQARWRRICTPRDHATRDPSVPNIVTTDSTCELEIRGCRLRVSKECVYARSPRDDPFASIAARKDATILRTSPLSRFPSNYPFDKILAMRFRAIVQRYTRRDWFRTGRIIVGEDTVEFDNIYGRIGSTVRTNLNFKLALLQDRVVESEDTKLDHLKSGSAVRSRGGKKVKTVRSAWFLVSDIADSRSLYLGKLTRKALFVAVFIIGWLNGHDPFPD